MTQTKRARIKAVKKDEHASRLLKVLRATGLFRWEKPSTHAEEIVNILTHGIGIGLAIGTALNWIFVATRLRKFSQAANDSITLPQYLTNRFASTSPVLKVICGVIFLISFTVYVASAFNAGTAVFVDVFFYC